VAKALKVEAMGLMNKLKTDGALGIDSQSPELRGFLEAAHRRPLPVVDLQMARGTARLLSSVAIVLVALSIPRCLFAQVPGAVGNEPASAVADLQTMCGDDDSQQRVAVPAELTPFVPPGATAVEWHRADLNLDGRPDYLLVIEHHCDERTLRLVVRQTDGALTLAAESDHLITCRSCGGMYGGYAGAILGRGSFTIQQETGSAAAGLGEKVTFVWSKKSKTWFVSAAEYSEHSSSGSYRGKDSEAIGLGIQEYSSHLQTIGG